MKHKSRQTNVVIVLAMHGIPPKDFPKGERKEYFELRAALRHAEKPSKEMLNRHQFLDEKIHQWPRTEENDPFHFGSMALGGELSRQSGFQVIVGFNEFCAPDLDEAIGQALALTTGKVIVTTPMMTRGGGHSKGDIPAAIDRLQIAHPATEIVYAWPFPESEIAQFLEGQIRPYI